MRLTNVLLWHTVPRPRRPRRSVMLWNNSFQVGRHLKVKDKGHVKACLDRGISVFEPAEVLSSHLPSVPHEEFDFAKSMVIRGPFLDERSHPNYHERPAYSFVDRSFFPTNSQLNNAKALFKAVEVEIGLPSQLRDLKLQGRIDPSHVEDMVRETQLFDATQKKLPRNFIVPYIGWHPVEDRMFRKMPYDVTNVSWGRKTRREYGVPVERLNMNLMRGMLRCCDSLAPPSKSQSVLGRLHLEANMLRVFFERGSKLVRFFVPLAQMITDRKPLPPYASREVVESTRGIQVPDITPFDPLVSLWPTHVYNDEPHFPLKAISSPGAPGVHFLHTCIDHNNNPIRDKRHHEGYHARSLALAFVAALGQARMLYGEDLQGDLPAPVTVNFVSTNGQVFHFSAFQLNTLDLADPHGIKNIFWHEEGLSRLYDTCGLIESRPTLAGFNPGVFSKFASIYLQNL